MPQELAYNTHSAVPSDYECADGELAMSLGAIYEDSALKPIMQPSPVVILRDTTEGYVAFIHRTTAYTHYIVNYTDVNKITWIDSNDIDPDTLYAKEQTTIFDYEGLTIYGFNAVGNTLVILTDEGMYYFLWKNDNEEYLALGNHMPELPISFGLQGTMYQNYSDEYDDEPETRETFEISYKEDDDGIADIWNDDKFSEWGEAKKSSITAQVLAKVNKFIANRATNKGRFIFPFFVRYAYRLYDDSLTMHSAPILMAANTKCMPIVGITDDSGNGQVMPKDTSATCIVIGMVHDLDYMIEGMNQSNTSYLDDLKLWSDIIKSVDIFISAPLYTYDQSGECTKFTNSYTRTVGDYGYCICKPTQTLKKTNNSEYSQKNGLYQKWSIDNYYDAYLEDNDNVLPQYHVELPNREDTAMEEIADIANFYILKSIPLEDLSTKSTRTKIDIEDDYLPSLVTRERMTDDYDSHDTLIPHYSFGYNSRLNIANITKRLFEGFEPYSLFNFTNAATRFVLEYYIHIRYEMSDIVIKQTHTVSIGADDPIIYFYYPSTNAYKVTFKWRDLYYEVSLTASDFLNGAYAFVGFDDLKEGITAATSEPTVTENLVEMSNKIYTSEVNNPFFFPLSGINTVGTGYIMALCAAAKALSQGQFGEFPLYAFCSDGVWALSISAEGLYTAVQPITRDVCINTDSITQLDSSVLFATDRGIMHISGSSLECISDRINSPAPFSLSALPKAEGVIEVYNKMAAEDMQLTLDEIDMIPFLDYIATCQMVYDYVNQHIIMYNTDKRYAYVFSLKSSAWGMLYSTAFSSVNSYPDAMANAYVVVEEADGNVERSALVDYSHPTVTDTTALILTRPFTLDSANSLKTIDTVIQRGMFPKKNIRQVLYGSRELYNWFAVRSSVDCYLRGFSGTPFKAFRLAMVCKLKQAETLYGATVEFTGRMANQPR